MPAKLIISILQVERGQTGKTIKNKNGTYDIGLMGINSIWLPELAKQGVAQRALQFDACQNVMAGTWIASKKIAGSQELATGIGNYNSRHFALNRNYYEKVKFTYTQIMLLLRE